MFINYSHIAQSQLQSMLQLKNQLAFELSLKSSFHLHKHLHFQYILSPFSIAIFYAQRFVHLILKVNFLGFVQLWATIQ